MQQTGTETAERAKFRRRIVSFGNPALGTYKGNVYTLEGASHGASHGYGHDGQRNDDSDVGDGDNDGAAHAPASQLKDRPIIEGAVATERIVAMVGVPPEQVPEGVLNLARAHLPSIQHVRIVIAEDDNDPDELAPSSSKHDGMELTSPSGTTKASLHHDHNHSQSHSQDPDHNLSVASLPHIPSMESAASALSLRASEDELHSSSRSIKMASLSGDTDSKHSARGYDFDRIHSQQVGDDEAKYSDSYQYNYADSTMPEKRQTERNYLVLVQLWTPDDAVNFVNDLDGQPYTILDESVVCNIRHVLALRGHDNVSLMSPIFAPSTKSTATGVLEILSSSSSIDGDGGKKQHDKRQRDKKAASPHNISEENHNCAVCLDHMFIEPRHGFDDTKEPSSILTTVCNHTFHLDCLFRCQDSPCPVCRYDHSGLNEALSQCHVCGTTERNYVCLICGVVSCAGVSSAANQANPSYHGNMGGNTDDVACRSSSASAVPPSASSSSPDAFPNANAAAQNHQQLLMSHARQHYDNTLHAYALDTETQHVWDFAGQGYVHRLLQNKEDGKIVEANDPNNTTSAERSLNPGLSDTQEGEVMHRKLEGFASQYYTLLKSQLEQQRIYYESRLQEIRREHVASTNGYRGGKARSGTQGHIAALRQERKQLSQKLVSMKRRHKKVSDDSAFLKSMNESLEKNKDPLRRKIADAQRQRMEARDVIQQSLPPLEEKLSKLMLQLEESVST